MTDAEKDAAWRLLPDGFKKEVSRHYKSWHNSLAFGGECAVLDYIFGKHNLTATEEEKPQPKFKVGDCVKVCISNNSVYRKGDVCLVMSVIKDNNGYHYELDRSRAMLISEEFLVPYSEEQKSKNGERIDSSSSLQNEIPSMSKEDAEELAKCLAAVDDFVKEYKDSQVDWLAYRMELAKAIAVAYAEKGRFEPKDIAVNTMWVVDGIVERLKGGEK